MAIMPYKFMTKEEYDEWKAYWGIRKKSLHHTTVKNPGEYLLLDKKTVNLPDYIKGTAKSTIVEAWGNLLWRQVKVSTIIITHWGNLDGYCFVDDNEAKMIDLKDYPLDADLDLKAIDAGRHWF